MSKRYFWLKQKADFFRNAKIKKLRKMAGGDTYTIIYQKLMLLSITDGGIIKFQGIENTFYEELALELDEEEINIQATLVYLNSQGLIEQTNEDEYLLPQVVNLIGSESDSAERVRKLRLKKNKDSLIESSTDHKALHCNSQVTKCNTEKEKEKEKELNINSYDGFLKNLKQRVVYKSKVTKTKEGEKLFKQIEHKEALANAYVSHQILKKDFAVRITAFMLDYEAYKKPTDDGREKWEMPVQ